MEPNPLIQHLNQPDTKIQDEKNLLQKTQKTPSTSEKVTSQKVVRSEFSISIPFVFHDITEQQKEHLLRMLSFLWRG